MINAIIYGVIGGLIISALLAVAIHLAESEFEGMALDLFQFGMVALAVILINQDKISRAVQILAEWLKVNPNAVILYMKY